MKKRWFPVFLLLMVLLMVLGGCGGGGGGSKDSSPDSGSGPSKYYPPGATNPADLVGTWNYTYTLNDQVKYPGSHGGTMDLAADGNWTSHEETGNYPGIWYVIGNQITIKYYMKDASEGAPQGSVFTGTIDDAKKSIAGTITYSSLGGGTWSGNRD